MSELSYMPDPTGRGICETIAIHLLGASPGEEDKVRERPYMHPSHLDQQEPVMGALGS